jgi:RpiB/LacA/LacB family sugar-phosphate isomerase
MKVSIACDHAGFHLKNSVIEMVHRLGHEEIDVGTFSEESVDYPEFVVKACEVILEGKAQRGVLLCGSGVGACITANKIRGIYAGLCHDTYSAHQGVEHDEMNVLCLGARVIGTEMAKELVKAFLTATFSGEERHVRRLSQMRRIEQNL